MDEDTLAALQRLGVALQEVLGRGMFGKVFKGTIMWPQRSCKGVDSYMPVLMCYGTVCSAESQANGAGLYQDMVVAVKIAEVSVPRARAKAHLTEVQIAGTLRHPNVVSTLSPMLWCCLRGGLQHTLYNPKSCIPQASARHALFANVACDSAG